MNHSLHFYKHCLINTKKNASHNGKIRLGMCLLQGEHKILEKKSVSMAI